MKFAFFNPTVIAVDDIPPDLYTSIKATVEYAHQHHQHNDEGDPTISVRGGQQIQLLPNEFGLDINELKAYIENRCQEYIDTVLKTLVRNDLSDLEPMLVSAWTIRQTSGDYQALHSHAAHISGNMYIDVPDLDLNSKSNDAHIEFRMPVIRNPLNFIFTDAWRFSPQPMKMLVFPSHLPHTVYPWSGQGTRTVLAWDVKLVSKKG